MKSPRTYIATGPVDADAPRAALRSLADVVRARGAPSEAEVGRRLGLTPQNWHNYSKPGATRPVSWGLVFDALRASGLPAHFRVDAEAWYLRNS